MSKSNSNNKSSLINNNFFDKVIEVVKTIPYGKVTTYGAIAEYLGSKQSSRAVGWAVNNIKSEIGIIPAHRVVNRNGILTGKKHFPSPTLMQELLESEGIEVENDKILNFKKHYWKPE